MPKTTTKTFGERLHEARTSHQLSCAELAFHTRVLLPRQKKLTGEAIRQYEAGLVAEENVNPVTVAAISSALGMKVSDLSPLVASDLQEIAEIISRTTCFRDAA